MAFFDDEPRVPDPVEQDIRDAVLDGYRPHHSHQGEYLWALAGHEGALQRIAMRRAIKSQDAGWSDCTLDEIVTTLWAGWDLVYALTSPKNGVVWVYRRSQSWAMVTVWWTTDDEMKNWRGTRQSRKREILYWMCSQSIVCSGLFELVQSITTMLKAGGIQAATNSDWRASVALFLLFLDDPEADAARMLLALADPTDTRRTLQNCSDTQRLRYDLGSGSSSPRDEAPAIGLIGR